MDIDRILGEWGGWAGRDGSSSVPVCSLEGADGGGVEWLDAPPHGEAAPSDPSLLWWNKGAAPCISSGACVLFDCSCPDLLLRGLPLAFGLDVVRLEWACSLWKCKAHCLKCGTCWPPLSFCWEPESPASPAGSGWEEQERVKAPFVWLGRAAGTLLAEAGTGLLLGPRGHWQCSRWGVVPDQAHFGCGDLGTRTESKLILGWIL